MRPKRRSSEVSIHCSLKPNLDLLPKSFIIFDAGDEFTNPLEHGSHIFTKTCTVLSPVGSQPLLGSMSRILKP